MSELKPVIAAVGYNRPNSLKRLLVSLNQASYPSEDITLIVSIDRSEVFETVRKVAEDTGWKHGEMIIRVAEKKLGLRNHILQCGDLSNEYGAVIILEDDLMVAENFYSYAVHAQQFYADHPRIAGVALYSHAWNEHMDFHFLPQQNGYDTYLGQFSVTWGQCWTKAQWNSFKDWYLRHENQLDSNSGIPADIENWGNRSWGKYFVYYIVETSRYYVMPYVALSTNCSEIGEHNGNASATYQVMMMSGTNKQYLFPEFNDAVKYDIFFERVFEPAVMIRGICSDEICFNLNGNRRDTGGKKYLLTSSRYSEFRLIRSFGLQLRPIEQNIISDITGDSLFLYLISSDEKNTPLQRSGVSEARIEYEAYNLGWKRAARYCVHDFARTVRGFLKAHLTRKK